MTLASMDVGKRKDPVPAESSKGNGALTPDHYRRVANALKLHKSITGASWEELAPEFGYKGSGLNLFANERYPIANAHHLCKAIEQTLATIEERRSLITEVRYVETTIARGINALLKKAVLLNKIVICAAESGTGKTTTFQNYYLQHPRAIYFKGNATFATSTASTWPLLVKLACALDNQRAAIGAKAMMYEIILGSLRNTGRLIIIDEAQFLQPGQLDLVRCLHEEARCPVVLGGNETLYERAGAFGSSASFVQFNSRSLRARFGTGDIDASDVELIAEQLVGIEFARDAAPILLEQARAAGGFRRLTTILQLAQTHRDGNGKVRKEHVLKGIREFAGGER